MWARVRFAHPISLFIPSPGRGGLGWGAIIMFAPSPESVAHLRIARLPPLQIGRGENIEKLLRAL